MTRLMAYYRDLQLLLDLGVDVVDPDALSEAYNQFTQELRKIASDTGDAVEAKLKQMAEYCRIDAKQEMCCRLGVTEEQLDEAIKFVKQVHNN